MRTITLAGPWTYRTPQKTIHYPAGTHDVFAYIADQAEAEDAIGGSQPAGTADEPDALDASITELTAQVAGITDPAAIGRLIAAETAGKTRKGALTVLKARKAELEG